MAVTDAIPCVGGGRVVRLVPEKDSNQNPRTLLFYVSQFVGDSFLSRTQINTYGEAVDLDPSATTFRIAMGRTTNTGVQISQEDIDTYFDAEIYLCSVAFTNYNSNAFIKRGSFQDLGYTSVSDCTLPGYYTFGGSDVIDDLPPGWSGGGLITVYINGNVVWQRIERLADKWIRYGLTGVWFPEHDLVYANYSEESGDDSSVAQLDIYVPRTRTNIKTMYRMGHCVDSSVNADVWRIIEAYNNVNNSLRRLTIRGEWECALHLEGRDDFSGGIVHGDEVDTSVTFFVDGTVTDPTTINAYCHELRIVRHSNIYDPADHTTVIAEHGVEYIYTTEGLTIRQSVKWLVASTLTNCYLAMLPIAKAYSTYRYDDTDFNTVENDQTGYSITIPNATSVTEYSETYDCLFTMSVPVYPTGLTGGDCALISDNGGLGYNKVYFPVCSSGDVGVGDIWKATTVFRSM